MISWIYARPIWLVVAIMIILPIARGLVKSIPKWLNIVFLCLSVVLILYATLYREALNDKYVYLTPLVSFEWAKTQPEYYREMLMNALLFLPIGLLLPFVFKRKNILFTVIIAILFSVFIESMQYVFALGIAETDDVIFNVLGAAFGSLSYLIFRMKNNVKCFSRFCKQKKNR